MEVERKSLNATVEDADTDSPYGGFTAVLSTPTRDRDGDEFKSQEWVTPLPDRITLDADHGMSVGTTIGSARPYFDASGRLMIDAQFSSIPRAQEVRTLVKEGHISSVSVAALVTTKDGVPSRELLNAGVVAIPANRDAVILAAKSASFVTGLDAILAGKSLGGDGAMLQAIHDASAHLGAECVVKSLPDDDEDEQDEDGASGAADGANSKALALLALRVKALSR